MRRLIALVGLMAAGCADSAPTSAVSSRDLAPSFSGSQGQGGSDRDSDGNRGRETRFNTRLRAATEIPVSTSTSRGDARVGVPTTGPINSRIEIDNRGNEVIRFCHIHVINTSAGTGPVVWFLTPTGVDLQLRSSFLLIGQDADYVNNAVFGADNAANEATARTALLANPSNFYVNCHSNTFPAGFIRGNLPGQRSGHH